MKNKVRNPEEKKTQKKHTQTEFLLVISPLLFYILFHLQKSYDILKEYLYCKASITLTKNIRIC